MLQTYFHNSKKLQKGYSKPSQICIISMKEKISRISKNPCLKRTNFMAPYHGSGSTALRLEPLQGGSLRFTTKFPETPGTHFIDAERMNS